MRREVKALREKAFNSLVLSVESFNRPRDEGRVEAVLIFLDHSFEMLLKASILHRKGKIQENRQKGTIGFEQCVRKALNDPGVKFIDKNDALTLQRINGLRDAAQHHVIDVSEQNLYLHAQAGLSLFRKIHKKVFQEDLYPKLPKRVLPLSTTPPADLGAVFENEVEEVVKLLSPGKRGGHQAKAKLRTLSIMEKSISGEAEQPTKGEINKLIKRVKAGETLSTLFPAVSSLDITAKGYGPSIDLRFSTKEGIPIRVVPEGTPGAQVVGIRKVNELDYYSLSVTEIARKLGVTLPKLLAVISTTDIKKDDECFKQISIGKTKFGRYSQKALHELSEWLEENDINQLWLEYHIARLKDRRKK